MNIRKYIHRTVAVHITYNRAGNLIKRLDAAGSGVSIGYDLAGRRISAVTAGGSTQKWRYDAMGNVNEITDGAGITHDN